MPHINQVGSVTCTQSQGSTMFYKSLGDEERYWRLFEVCGGCCDACSDVAEVSISANGLPVCEKE